MNRFKTYILGKLGIVKTSNEDFIEAHQKIVNLYAETILKGRCELPERKYNEALCEVKAFLWAEGEYPLEPLETTLYEATYDNFLQNVLFSSLDKSERESKLITEFGDRLFKNYDTDECIQEFSKLNYLWFINPFASKNEVDQHVSPIIKSATDEFEAFANVAPIIKHLIPEYLNALQKLVSVSAQD